MSEPTEKKKGSFLSNNIGTILNVASWIVFGAFYLGVHRGEMQNIQRNFEEIKAIQEKSIRSIDSRFEVINLKINTLETSRVFLEQKTMSADRGLSSIDVRVVRLEDAIPKIALLTQEVQNVKDSQKEMKQEMKILPEIQIGLAEVKTLLEKSLKVE